MVYIASDGRIHQKPPWPQRLVLAFWGILNFIFMFFKTMFDPNVNRNGNSYSRDYRGGGGPPRPPTRRIGRISDVADCNIPGGG